MKFFFIFLKTFENSLESFVKFQPKMLPIKISVFLRGWGGGSPEAIGFIQNLVEKSIETWKF